MSLYLTQVTYTSEAWATLVQNPQHRIEAVRPVVEQLEGTLHGGWLAFGEHNIVLLVEFPHETRTAAFAMAAATEGTLKAIKTTRLIPAEETGEAMALAAGAGYPPE